MDILTIVLICVIIFQEGVRIFDKRETVRRERELLNRIMTRDYAQYAQVEGRQVFMPVEEEDSEEEGVAPV